MTNQSTKDISPLDNEKKEFVDKTMLLFNIKLCVSRTLQPFAGKMKPDILNKIMADFTLKFFFQMCDTKMLLEKDNRRDILTEEYLRHMRDYLNFYMNTMYDW